MSDKITTFYNNINSIYCDSIRYPIDKAKAFRTEFERFLKYYINKNGTLNELLKDFYKMHRRKLVNDISHTLRKKLNQITHGTYNPEPDEIKNYFEAIIRIIFIATQIKPPQKTFKLLGITTNDLLKELNEKQKIAVLEEKRIVFVNAGPGTGKTHLLVNKIYHFMKESTTVENIVALSYTNSAASELQNRLSNKVFFSGFIEYNCLSSTIHSFALKSLRSYSKSINSNEYNFLIIAEDEIEFFAEEINQILSTNSSTKEILQILRGNNSSEYLSNDLIKKIKQIKKKYKLIGFKDILLNFKKALQSDIGFVNWLKPKISFILVDEAQDLTKLEYEILDMLLEKTNMRLFLVGDPRQNIFGFNGGSYKHLNAFSEHHQSEFKELVLDTSYRCPNDILEKLNKFEQ